MKALALNLAGVTGLLILCQIAALGAPFAKKIPFTQPDGTPIVLWGQGDEFYAVFETLDGYTVVFNPQTKAYEYAALSADGDQLISTGIAVGHGNPAAPGLARHLRINPKAVRRQAAERFALWDKDMEVTRRWNDLKAGRGLTELAPAPGDMEPAPPSSTTTGQKLGLTLLIDFSDAVGTIPQAEVVNYCNGENYTGYGNNGSVKRYFLDNSNNQLTYSNLVTIYIRAPQPKTYYNDTTIVCDTQGRLLINDALTVMKALPNYQTEILPTFANLTVDGSSRVVACNVFFAGGDSGVWNYGLWPHSSSLVSAVDLGNGKKVYRYQITNIGTSLALGTFCHENGHMLCGFPDIYDYDYDSEGGAGVFCLMDYGGSGGNPVQVCAYLKRAAGWATTIDLSSNSVLTASASSSGANFNQFYRYAKPGVATEYFLVENRQKSGRDATLPASGIAIWHIDELGDHNNQSTNFNTSHLNYEVSLMQADNLWHFQNDVNTGDSKDLYYLGNTATGYSNTFSDVTSPSARWWDGSASGIKFHHFSTSGATMTFGVGPEGPNIVVDSAALAAEGCMPTNGVIDPNETVLVNFALKNTGGWNTTNLVVTLLATNGVTSPSGPQTYGSLAANGAAVTRPFTFTATGNCGGTNIAALQLHDGPTNLGTLAVSFRLGVSNVVTGLSENLDAVAAPELPTGWTSSASNAQSAWVSSTAASDTPPNSVFSPDPASVGVNELVTPAIMVPASSAQLSFRHSYNLESSYDGGVLEIMIGAGSWTDILAAGGSFVSGGYVTTLSSSFGNPLAGRSAWTGSSGGFITTLVNLPPTASGQTIQLRWRCGSDSSVSGSGWYVDTVSVAGSSFACCTSADLAVALTASPDPVVGGQNLTYTLTVTNLGPDAASGVTLTDTLPASLTFVSASPGCVNLSGQVVATVATLSSGSGSNFTLVVTPNLGGLITNVLTVGALTPDLNSANNTTSIVTTVNAPPMITAQPNSQTAIAGTNVTFQVAAAGTAPLAYQWRFNGTNVEEAIHPALTVTNVLAAQAGTYTVSVTNDFGSVLSTNAVLTVLDPFIVAQPQSQFVAAGAAATFTASAAGTMPLSYQWQRAGTNLAGATTSSLTLPNVQCSDAGAYTLLVSNSLGTALSHTAMLTVSDTTPPAITCLADVTVVANAGCRATNVALGVPLTSDNCGMAAVTNNAVASYPVGTNVVTWTATDTSGNTNWCQQQVIVLDRQAPTIAWHVTNVVVAVGTNCQALMPDITGTNYILAEDPCSSVTVTQSVATNAVLGLGTTEVVLGAFDAAGNTAYCTNTVLVVDQTPPIIACPADLVVTVDEGQCSKSNVTWTMTATDNCAVTNLVSQPPSGSTFPAGVTTVHCTAADASGNTNLCSFTVTVIAPTYILTQPLSQAVTQGQDTVFSVGATNGCGLGLAYQWRWNGAEIAGAKDSTYTRTNTQCADAGSFDVVVTSLGNSLTSSVAGLIVVALPVILSGPPDQTVPLGQDVTFCLKATNDCGGQLTYQWRFQAVDIWGATTNCYTFRTFHPTNAGSYDVVVADGAGVVTSPAAVLTVVGPYLTVVPAEPSSNGGGRPNLVFTYPSVTGIDYVVQYHATLQDTSGWLALGTNSGTGSLITNDFPITTDPPGRFYRIRLP